jgi:hypothetical protein
MRLPVRRDEVVGMPEPFHIYPRVPGDAEGLGAVYVVRMYDVLIGIGAEFCNPYIPAVVPAYTL